MGDFRGTILTNRGRNLLAKAQTGVPLRFTRIGIGDGVWSQGTDPATLTALVSQKMSLPIQSLQVTGDGTVRLRFVLTNQGLTSGFFIREIGIFAHDPDIGEMLYAVTYAGDRADYIPAAGATLIENVVDIYTVVSNTQNVTANISDTVVLATKQDIERLNSIIEDKLNGYRASQTPSPNTIPVTGADGRLNPEWLPSSSFLGTYSRLTVGTSLPASPQHNDLFYNTSDNTLRKYDARTNTWTSVDWQTIVRASPEWQAGRLRINSSTGRLEISPDGTNWYPCIPAVGSQAIELASIDNNNYSLLYWIAPGQTVIIRNANHVPNRVCKGCGAVFLWVDSLQHLDTSQLWVGVRPSNVVMILMVYGHGFDCIWYKCWCYS